MKVEWELLWRSQVGSLMKDKCCTAQNKAHENDSLFNPLVLVIYLTFNFITTFH